MLYHLPRRAGLVRQALLLQYVADHELPAQFHNPAVLKHQSRVISFQNHSGTRLQEVNRCRHGGLCAAAPTLALLPKAVRTIFSAII